MPRAPLCLLVAAAALLCLNAYGLGSGHFVAGTSSPGSFCLFDREKAATIFVDTNDWPGAVRVARDLHKDIERVSGTAP